MSLLASDSRRAGVLWLARSLESAEGRNDPFEPAIRANLAAWSPLVHRLKECLEHDGPVRVVAWSPSGRAIATGSDDGIVRIWDSSSSSSARRRRSSSSTRGGCGHWLSRGTARPWRRALTTRPRGCGTRPRAYREASRCGHRGPVVSVAFSPDDSTLVTGSEDGTVRLWNAVTGDPRGKPLEHGKPLKSMVLAPDGKSLASLDEPGGVDHLGHDHG